jgi:CRP/FNR family transcriptional regulator, cyclic AMP receptor protein
MKWPLLAHVPEEDVQLVLSVARRRKFDRGEVVFHEHDPADTLHLIDKGRFVARVGTPLGDTAILTVMGPGDMFGELSLLGSADERRSATVAALEPGETRSVHRLDFERLRARHPETSEILIAILSGQVRRLTTHLVEALYVPAEKRVRRRLVEMVAVYDDGTAEVVVPLNQEDLAGLAGTSRATANRVLREEEGRGTVKLGRGRTTVLDVEAVTRRGR